MRRTYNHKVSRRTNHAAHKRAYLLQMKGQTVLLIIIIIVSFVVLLKSSISVFAGARKQDEVCKYYTSIQVQRGDTLWDIAERYIADGNMGRKEFIDEVTQLNGLTDGQIRSGEYIVVSYYAQKGQ